MDDDRNFLCEGCGKPTPIVYNVEGLMFCRKCKTAADARFEPVEAEKEFEENL